MSYSAAIVLNRIRRELMIGGMAGVQHVDRRLPPYIWVNPLLIEYKHPTFLDRAGPKLGARLFRDDLDFENNLVSVEEFEATDIRPRFYREVLNLGLPLKETSEFRFHMENIARRGWSWKDARSEDDVLRFLESKVRIFEEIRRTGEVRPSQEISGKRRDEIGCLIDHRGHLVKGHNGNNRFSIARMLRLPWIPVHIDAIDAGQMAVVKTFKGATPIAKINRYLQNVQEKYARR
jgi:hypothetical protein